MLAALPPREHENNIRLPAWIRRRKPVVESVREIRSRHHATPGLCFLLTIARPCHRFRNELSRASPPLRDELVNRQITPGQQLPVLVAQNHLTTAFPELLAKSRAGDKTLRLQTEISHVL